MFFNGVIIRYNFNGFSSNLVQKYNVLLVYEVLTTSLAYIYCYDTNVYIYIYIWMKILIILYVL